MVTQLVGGSGHSSNGCQSSVDCTSKVLKLPVMLKLLVMFAIWPYKLLWGSGQVICPGLEADTCLEQPGMPIVQLSPICATDCSGLVSLAIYDVFGNNGDWDTYSMITDKANFEIIPLSKFYRWLYATKQGHVVIIESVSGNTLNTFAAIITNRYITSRSSQPRYLSSCTY